MARKKTISRREFLRISAIAVAGVAAASCAGPTEEVEEEPTEPEVEPTEPEVEPTEAEVEPTEAEAEPGSRYNEAPMLAQLVEAGELPPVDERLPLEPCVMENMDGTIGNYGGKIRRGMKGISDLWGPHKISAQNLLWWTPAEVELYANVAKAWEVNDDATEYTVYLREGLRWSDGQPFGVEDFRYWFEDVLLNETLTPAIDPAWKSGEGDEEAVMEMEFPDDFTVVYKFAHTNPLFVYELAATLGCAPAHHMKQFHMELTDDQEALEQEIEDAGFATWDEYYWEKDIYYNPEKPLVRPWIAKTSMKEELFIMERNPYAFHVDPEGNQLPYVDTIEHRRFEEPDVFNLWIVNGEIDCQARHCSLEDFTLYKESEADGEYFVHTATSDATQVLALNLSIQDENMSEFFMNSDVRKALSYAINRSEINELVYDGLGTPRQYSPPSGSPQYWEELSNAYLDYDPDRANEMLDEAGYSERNADDMRVWPGTDEPISFVMEQMGESQMAEMVKSYLADVGINAIVKVYKRALVYEHIAANKLEAAIAGASRAALPMLDPKFFLSLAGHKLFGIGWRHWYYNPEDPAAVEPPEGHWVWDLWDLWDQIQVTADAEERNQLFRQMLEIHLEELPLVGLVGELPAPWVIKNDLHAMAKDFHPVYTNSLNHEGLLPYNTFYYDNPEQFS